MLKRQQEMLMKKYEETTRRLNSKEKNYAIMSKRANAAGNRLEDLEKEALNVARKLGQSETIRENAAKKEDALKKKLIQLQKQLIEAESRASYMEEEQNKLELLANQMKEEKEVLRKMKEKKCVQQT